MVRDILAADMERTLLAQVDLGKEFLLQPGGSPVAEVYDSPATLINQMLPNIFTAAGILVFFFIFLGGFKIVTSSDNKKGIEEGKKSLTYAIMGLALLFSAFWIIQIIQVLTGVQIL